MVEDVHALLCQLDFLLAGEQAKGRLPQKKGKMWEFDKKYLFRGRGGLAKSHFF